MYDGLALSTLVVGQDSYMMQLNKVHIDLFVDFHLLETKLHCRWTSGAIPLHSLPFHEVGCELAIFSTYIEEWDWQVVPYIIAMYYSQGVQYISIICGSSYFCWGSFTNVNDMRSELLLYIHIATYSHTHRYMQCDKGMVNNYCKSW